VFHPRSDYMEIMMDKASLWQFFSEYLGFLCQLPSHQLLRIQLSPRACTIGPLVARVPNGLHINTCKYQFLGEGSDVAVDLPPASSKLSQPVFKSINFPAERPINKSNNQSSNYSVITTINHPLINYTVTFQSQSDNLKPISR
jgi:hypothetical protein